MLAHVTSHEGSAKHSMIELPTLSDGDVILRPRRLADADALAAACQDPEIPRWTMVPSPYTRADALAFLSRADQEAAAGDSVGLLAVDPDGRLLGSLSLMDLRHEPGYGEIGYWLAAEARGRGVATRAVRLLTDWGHRTLRLERVEIHVHVDNAPSHGVPQRAGYERLDGLVASPRTGVEEPVFVRYVSRRR
jgi:RimJ/RimL family protein N-acetyltransferase